MKNVGWPETMKNFELFDVIGAYNQESQTQNKALDIREKREMNCQYVNYYFVISVILHHVTTSEANTSCFV